MKYTAILLVIASDDISRIDEKDKPHFPILKKAWESYIHTNPNVKTFFVYGAGTNFEPKEHDLIYNHIIDSHGLGMLAKTLEAIDYINKNYNYDFLIRTNLSQFWIFDNLIERLNKLPKTRCLTGTLVKKLPYPYIAGWDIHMSRDLTEILLTHKDEILDIGKSTQYEDQVMCNTLRKYTDDIVDFRLLYNNLDLNSTYPLSPPFADSTFETLVNNNFDIDSLKNVPHYIDHIRFKLKNRSNEKILVQHLIKKFYNIDFIPKYPAI